MERIREHEKASTHKLDFASVTWCLAVIYGLSNFWAFETDILAWTTVWMWSGILWYFGAIFSLILSVCTLISAVVADSSSEKKACVVCGVTTLVISVLIGIPAFFTFGTWGVFG